MTFLQAKYWTWVSPQKPRTVSLLVLHTMEAPDKPTTAEGVAAMFHGANSPQASAHVCIDSDSIVECVAPEHIAWGAGGANWAGYQIEQAGYAKWTRAEWLSDQNRSMLRLVAEHLAKMSAHFAVPLTVLDEESVALCLRDGAIRQGKTPGALSALKGGITTHRVTNAAWRKWSLYGLPQPKPGTDLSHWDCGDGYPTDVVTAMAVAIQNEMTEPRTIA